MSVLRHATGTARGGAAQPRRHTRRPDSARTLYHHPDPADQHRAVPGPKYESAIRAHGVGRQSPSTDDARPVVASDYRRIPAWRNPPHTDELLGAVRPGR